jgi:hypothetical protein
MSLPYTSPSDLLRSSSAEVDPNGKNDTCNKTKYPDNESCAGDVEMQGRFLGLVYWKNQVAGGNKICQFFDGSFNVAQEGSYLGRNYQVERMDVFPIQPAF